MGHSGLAIMSGDRTAEIWSTRVQRELLALTSEGNDEKGEVAMLPPFITVKEHTLDIAKGLCKIAFLIEVDKPKQKAEGQENTERGDDGEKADEEDGDKSNEGDKSKVDSGAVTGSVGDGTKIDEDGGKAREKVGTKTEEASASTRGTTDDTDAIEPLTYVTVSMDTSLETKPDGTVEASPRSYPFQKPRAVLLAGSELFSGGSSVQDGDFIDIDCDWTPSLHLSDAIMNVALKIRECIRRGEPFYSAVVEQPKLDPLEGALQSARKMGSSFFSTMKSKKFNLATTPLSSESEATQQQSKSQQPSPKQPRQPSEGRVQIGDLLDLTESPWNVCEGMYSCKAIRRPEFVEDAIAIAEAEAKKDEVAGAGFAGAGSMFRSFAQSAKSLVEESFLMITDEQIIELRSSKLNINNGTVTFAIPISMLAKLKFRRQESISLFFKQAPDDPLIFMCPDSADAVQQIQTVLKKHGVKGKHTNAATQRSIQTALGIVAEIQKKEKALDIDPTVEKVNAIMDLYRQAAEKFEQAGDPRHEEVMTHMHKFLAKPLTASILDGSYAKKNQKGSSEQSALRPVPQGEVLERPNYNLDDEDDDDDHKGSASTPDTTPAKKPGDDAAFDETMDDILQEAKRDMEKLNMDNDLDGLLSPDSVAEKKKESKANNVDGDADPVAELDAMLSAADKELADIMDS